MVGGEARPEGRIRGCRDADGGAQRRRAVVGDDPPDFRTLSDFRKIHRAAFKPLFLEVLRLAGEMGMSVIVQPMNSAASTNPATIAANIALQFPEASGVEVHVLIATGLVLYVLRQAALQASFARLAGLSVGKGCIRFRRPEQIDPEVVRELLAATLADTGSIC